MNTLRHIFIAIILVTLRPNLQAQELVVNPSGITFTDISVTGTLLGTGDDVAFPLDIGGTGFGSFIFPGGTSTDMITINTNGFITSDPTDAGSFIDVTNDCPLPLAPSSGLNVERLYLLHDDLGFFTGGSIYYQYFSPGSAGHPGHAGMGNSVPALVIMFDDIGHFLGTPPTWDMELILYPNGEFAYVYSGTDPEDGSASTVGYQVSGAGPALEFAPCNTAGRGLGSTILAYFYGDPALIPTTLPNCRTSINAAVDRNGLAIIRGSELVPDTSAFALTVDVTNPYGGPITSAFLGNPSEILTIDACAYIHQTLKLRSSNTLGGTCWTELTFKQSNGPLFGPGRVKEVYCFDDLVFDGDIDDTPPVAVVPCTETVMGTFVADWVTPFDCEVAGNDTAKIIYREYEAFDKQNRRASVFDTIIVHRLPLLSTSNVYCPQKDTIYCGDTTGLSPYLFVRNLEGAGGFDVPFVDVTSDENGLHFAPAEFDTKCGLNVHVDYLKFDDICSPQYKVTVEIKQDCPGSPGPAGCVGNGSATTRFFGIDNFSNTFIKQDLLTGANQIAIPISIPNAFAGEFANGTLYFAAQGDDRLYTMDTTTGAQTAIGSMGIAPSNTTHSGLAYDATSGTMYATSTNSGTLTAILWTVDLNTGLATQVGDLGIDGAIWLAINEQGDAYVLNHVTNDLWRVNLTNASSSLVGPIGFDPNFCQGADFDPATGILYAALFNGGNTTLSTIDLTSGANTPVRVIPGEFCPVAIPPSCAPLDASGLETTSENYWTCTYWVVELDTAAPVAACKYDYVDEGNLLWPFALDNVVGTTIPNNVHCYPTNGEPVIIVPTTTHDCAAYAYIPPICVYDWTGVKQVKASISGLGAWVLEPNGDTCEILVDGVYEDGECWESHDLVTLPKSEGPIEILYEVYDSCHNIDSIYCYLLVKDKTKPVAVADKGVTVSLTDKKVWVDAETFDEGSWDNCGVNLLLARRSDWYEACIDLCDNKDLCYVGPHHDSLWYAYLETDKDVDPVEAHYAKTIEWLLTDEVPCSRILANAWAYDLLRYATAECFDHPYEITPEYVSEHVYYGLTALHSGLQDKFYPESPHAAFGCPDDGYDFGSYDPKDLKSQIDTWSQIGGGWSDAVPFSCEDACGPVTVEILVMDYWCNWSTAWTTVWVEDKTPIEVVKDVVEEIDITCATYKDDQYYYPGEIHAMGLDDLVALGKDGDSLALSVIDTILGGYCKAWKDPYGNYVDIDGNEIDCDIHFTDAYCHCEPIDTQIRVYDDHFGYIWKDSTYTKCYYETEDVLLQKGVIVVNCAENVYCEQELWCEFDHCGQGYIFRKWKIWQGCPPYNGEESAHIPDTTYRHQRIWVGNECDLSKFMFDVPVDITVTSCALEYDPAGSGQLVGDLDPEITGYPTYKFDDDCRIIGIGHQDKVFKVVGGDEACYKVVRTWYFADWCGGKPVDSYWWHDRELIIDSCVQKIIVQDTVGPVCTITGPVNSGDTIEVSGCDYNFAASVSTTDACGVISYSWVLKQIEDGVATEIDSDLGALSSDTTDAFDIGSDGLLPGTYKLVVTTVDECQNEGICEYDFTLLSAKKPTPICITLLSATLTPWDTDGDGVIDSAHAVIWASEFNSSSALACEDDSLAYRIEFVDGIDDDTYLEDSASLDLTCANVGTKVVRLWVLSYPSGTADYCDVILMVNSNGEGCDVSSSHTPSGKDMAETEEQGQAPDRNGVGSDQPDISGDAPQVGGSSTHAGDYKLEQNRPNPFREETLIEFSLPEAMEATITIYDVTGRQLRQIQGDFTRGYNQVQFRKEGLQASGILFYQLRTAEYTEVKRMMLVE